MEFFTYLLKSAAIATLFYIVYFVFLRKNTLFTTKRHFFISGIIAAFTLPFIHFTKTISMDAPVKNLAPISEINILPIQNQAPIQETIAIDWWQIGLLIYAMGVLFMLSKVLVQLVSLLRVLFSYPSEKKAGFRFVKTSQAIAPFSFFNYIVYHPASHSSEELEMILKHEQIHARQWHSADILLASVLQSLQWINPFSWGYKKAIEENLEFIADSETVVQISSKKQYQLALVKASSPLIAPALTTQFYQSFIKKRIIMLNKQHSNKRNALKAMIILPLLALFLWSFNVKEVVQFNEVIQPSEILIDNTHIEENTLASSTENEQKDTTHASKASLQDINKKASHQSTVAITEATPTKTPPQPEIIRKKKNKSFSKNNTLSAEFKVKITKDTSEEEFQKIKKELKDEHNIDFSYTVVRNESKEIIDISLTYRGNGNSGSYSIGNDGPIDEFHFYMDGDGKTHFYSVGKEKQTEEHMKKKLARLENKIEGRNNSLAKRNEEIQERLEKRNEQIQERLEKRQEEMEIRHEEMQHRREEMHERMQEMKEDHEHIETLGNHITAIQSGNGNRVYASSGKNASEHIHITKNTSDAELETIKNDLATKGVSFSYKRVRRNAKGEIISIKLDLDDNKGSRTQTSITGDNDEPIDTLFLEI